MKLENAFKKLNKEGFSNINKIGNNGWVAVKPRCAYGITFRASMVGDNFCQTGFIKVWPVKNSENRPTLIFKTLTNAIKYANAA